MRMIKRRARKPSPKRRPKTATNLSLRTELVQRARAVGLNLSQVVEVALAQAIREAERAKWLTENEQAIADYNRFVEKHGLFGEEFREF
jgi:antitoxin CcdA